jgi:hypothetical protein
MKKLLLLIAVLFCGPGAANATIVFSASGTSAKGVDVTFQAQLTLIDDNLTITLTNDSPVDSLNPDDLLGSFYFDIVNGDGDRPGMMYVSAAGDTWKGVKNGADVLLEAGADLRALAPGDNSWQFKPINAAYIPNLGFGLGTVGNSGLSPNGFDGNIVDGVDFAIYKGEITTQPLTNPSVLVKETAVFIFSGLTGFTEADIQPMFAFGLGTAPDSLLVPEPATMLLLGLGGLLLRKRR